MKSIILIASIALSISAGAQTQQGRSSVSSENKLKEGKVIYELTTQLTWTFRDPNSEFAKNAPKTRKENFELLFGNNKSVFQTLPDINAEAENASGVSASGVRTMVTSSSGRAGTRFADFEKGKQVSERELNAKNYIIEDSITKLRWKLSEETKEILGYKAMKATTQNIGTKPKMSMENGVMKREVVADTANITAWFTTDIPVPAGPDFQGQLPGLILELDINHGNAIYKALEVMPKVNLSSIKEPKGGKRISLDEFKKEQERSMEEMRKRLAENGGTIRIQQ